MLKTVLIQKLFPEGTRFEYKTPVDTTTSGSKNVTVVVKDKDGNTLVEVPAVVKVAKPGSIETPITNDKFTPEDIAKNVEIPEGAKVTKVEGDNNLDLTTPGKKDPVKVTVELPNGKVITVEVPVTVTPINEIVKNVGDPITNEDVEKNVKIPEGGKIISIGNKPGTETPGVKPTVPVVIELPNGKQITVEVPVIVTPKVSTIIVPQGTVITPEDVKNHIDLPKEPGWEIVEVGEIPSTVPAGVKPSVKVKVKLPNGRVIDLEVPVISTPKVTPIEVEVGTPITKEDVKKHVELPKEEGWEIVEVGEIPTTETAGQKPSVKVKVKLPTGEIVEVEVPVTVTPKKETPTPRPEKPSTPEVPATPEAPKAPVAKAGEKVLPNTGIADENSALAGLGLAILGLAAAARRRKQK